MTTINTDYNNTELLDQELTTAELSEVSGGWWNNYNRSSRFTKALFNWDLSGLTTNQSRT
ncbi:MULTISPECIES: hypothetical protein [unclassified Prochlorococcus]|uniref:hypothetical protein n=1 Tax=unclassified Prochlorococcus TaxID=2627481 RepID=UPI0012678A1C|nr:MULTISPECIES: hypothetical protein [unclassified Prochlorococcus]